VAGIFALVNQMRTSAVTCPLGSVNSTLDSLAQSAAYATHLHDISVGKNILPGSSAGFSAAPGYDLASGRGTPKVMN
jgi:hypothetical protein